MAGISGTIEGLDTLERNLATLADAQPTLQAAGRELFAKGSHIMRLSARLAPVRNRFGGTLRAAATTLPPEIRGAEVSVVIGYGGAADPYALAAHENPRTGKTGGLSPRGRRYTSWSEVGQWKFLEEPFLAEEQGTLDGLASATRASIEKRLASGTLLN